MFTRPLPLLALSVFIWAPSRPAAAADPTPSTNPALLYWQAAALLQPVSDDGIKNLEKMTAGETPADPAQIAKLYFGPMETLLKKAANSEAPCDWGVPLGDGPDTVLSYPSKMQQMAKIAIMEAQAAFADDRVAAGMDWLLTVHRMARHTGTGELYITFIVQSLLNELAIRTAAQHCLAWDESTRHAYAAQLLALPKLPTWRASYLQDQKMATDWLERRLQTDGPQRGAELVEQIWGSKLNDKREQDSSIPKDGAPAQWDTAKWREEIEKCRALQHLAAASFDKPWPQGQADLEVLRQAVADEKYSIFRLSYMDASNLYRRGYTTETLWTMLGVALRFGAAVTEADAATSHDSIEGEPLRLMKGDDGSLRLVAARPRLNGKPIELKLGR